MSIGGRRRTRLVALLQPRAAPRGSVITRTALRGGADLDVDLLLPFEVTQRYFGDLAQRPMEEIELPDRWARFQELTKSILWALTTGLTGFTSDQVHPTRSVRLITTVNGTPVDVDLFPKLVDPQGKVWSPIGAVDGNGNRLWSSVPFGPPFVRTDDWTDEQHLAVLLVKLWKKKWKDSHKAKYAEMAALELKRDQGTAGWTQADQSRLKQLSSELKQFDFPKGYHLNLAMGFIATLDLPRLAPSTFSIHKTIGYLRRLVAYLRLAYHPLGGVQDEFYFNDSEGVRQPFLKDIQGSHPDFKDHQRRVQTSDLQQLYMNFARINQSNAPPAGSLQDQVCTRLSSLLSAVDEWSQVVDTVEAAVPTKLLNSAYYIGNRSAGFMSFKCMLDEFHLQNGFDSFDSFTPDLMLSNSTSWSAQSGVFLVSPELRSILIWERNPSYYRTFLKKLRGKLRAILIPSKPVFTSKQRNEATLIPIFNSSSDDWSLVLLDDERYALLQSQEYLRGEWYQSVFQATKFRMMKLEHNLNGDHIPLPFSHDTVGLLGDELVWVLPPVDEFHIDTGFRPYLVLEKFKLPTLIQRDQRQLRTELLPKICKAIKSAVDETVAAMRLLDPPRPAEEEEEEEEEKSD